MSKIVLNIQVFVIEGRSKFFNIGQKYNSLNSSWFIRFLVKSTICKVGLHTVLFWKALKCDYWSKMIFKKIHFILYHKEPKTVKIHQSLHLKIVIFWQNRLFMSRMSILKVIYYQVYTFAVLKWYSTFLYSKNWSLWSCFCNQSLHFQKMKNWDPVWQKLLCSLQFLRYKNAMYHFRNLTLCTFCQ